MELLLHVEKQRQRAEEVVVVYEAGPLGYTLYRKLTAAGVLCYVCSPDGAQQRKKRRKNNKIDARTLTSKLFNYLNGDKEALQLARSAAEPTFPFDELSVTLFLERYRQRKDSQI